MEWLETSLENFGPQIEERLVRLLEARALESGTITALGLRDTLRSMLEPLHDDVRRLQNVSQSAVPVPQPALASSPAAPCAMLISCARCRASVSVHSDDSFEA
jgi:hypothetical protein